MTQIHLKIGRRVSHHASFASAFNHARGALACRRLADLYLEFENDVVAVLRQIFQLPEQ
jgi:hypothetical protein